MPFREERASLPYAAARQEIVAVIPAFNEAATIGGVVAAASRYVCVLVVDDCSTDGTGEKAEEQGAIVIRNLQNLGYDGTLNRGFEAALQRGFRHIVTIDADGEHNPELLAAFADALIERQIPLILGVRPSKQRFAEAIMGWYVYLRFGAHDILCGMKGYNAQLVRANGGFDTSNSIGTELALNSIRRGNAFVEISVNGSRRLDQPRFGRLLRANLRIFGALRRLIAADLASGDKKAPAKDQPER